MTSLVLLPPELLRTSMSEPATIELKKLLSACRSAMMNEQLRVLEKWFRSSMGRYSVTHTARDARKAAGWQVMHRIKQWIKIQHDRVYIWQTHTDTMGANYDVKYVRSEDDACTHYSKCLHISKQWQQKQGHRKASAVRNCCEGQILRVVARTLCLPDCKMFCSCPIVQARTKGQRFVIFTWRLIHVKMKITIWQHKSRH